MLLRSEIVIMAMAITITEATEVDTVMLEDHTIPTDIEILIIWSFIAISIELIFLVKLQESIKSQHSFTVRIAKTNHLF